MAQPPVLLQLGQVSAVKPVFSGQASSEMCATAVYIVGPAGHGGRLIKTGCIVHIQTTGHYDHIPLGCRAREFVRGFPYLLAPPHPTNGNGMEQFFLERARGSRTCTVGATIRHFQALPSCPFCCASARGESTFVHT